MHCARWFSRTNWHCSDCKSSIFFSLCLIVYQCIRYNLTHWGRVMHICNGKLTIIGSDNGLSPGRRQAIIWTNAGILLIGPLGTNFSEILMAIETFSFKKMHLKKSSAKWRPFCLGLNVLTDQAALLGISEEILRHSPLCRLCQLSYHKDELYGLTHWDWNRMAAIFQTTFSNVIFLMKMYQFQLRFHWNSQVSNYQYSSFGSDNGLVLLRQQAINRNNDG